MALRGLKAFKAACLLALAIVAGSCRSSVEGLGVKIDLQIKKLDNGLTIILVEDHTVPLISYQTWFRVGSVDEKPGKTGIAHLFEHLMFKGNRKYGPKEFFQQLEAKGADVNAFTTRDYTAYYETFTPDLLEKVIDMESDRMANLSLNEEVLKSEQQVVLEERRLRTDNSPSGRLQEALWSLSYSRHPYKWPVIGLPQDLLSVQVEDLRSFFSTYYSPSNATIVAVGDLNATRTFKMIEKAYGGIPSKPRPARKIAAEPEQKGERRLRLFDHTASERFVQSYHVTAASNEESYAIDVLASILFDGTSSRAYRRLVEEKDLVLSISGSAYTPTYPGLFMISGTMKGDAATELAERELDQLIREIQESGVSQDEVKKAVRQLTVQLVDSVRTAHGKGQLIGTIQMILERPERFGEDLEKYLKVTPDDVRRVATKYLRPNNRNVVTLLPEEKRKGAAAL